MMNRDEARRMAHDLVSQMTLEEKASQLRFDSPAIPRLGIPAYNWWNEALHGVARAGTATVFPQAIGLAAIFDEDFHEEVAKVISQEARAKYNGQAAHGDRDIYKGLSMWSPNINIFRDPRWGRGHETYGEDPYLTSRLGVRFIKGLQGDGKYLKVAACAKHFAVHSGPEAIRHEFDAVVSPKDLWETYLPAFEAAVKEAGVESVMGAYNRVNGEAACGSQTLLVDILRRKWGFEGHVTSDCWAIRDFHTRHMVTSTAPESAALALKMGCDVNCGNTYIYMMKAYEQGLVTEEEIRTAAIHLFTTRYLLGIMEGSEFDSIPYSVVECPEHLAKAHQATLESCVLLKNDGLLPLDPKKIKTLAVIGPNANSRHALIGNYYGTSSRYVTVLEGLQDALGEGVRVLYSEGCHLFKDVTRGQVMKDNLISEAVTVTEEADAAVVVVGLDETLEGEQGDTGNADASGDKLNLLLPASQRRMLDAVLSVGKPTVIVLMAGSAIDLGDAADKADAVMLAWYPGARGGRAVAELLLGKKSPSGKLPVTFYHNSQLDEMPAFTDYAMQGRTYRYFPGEPLYPFGYGLTYGDVAVTAAEAEQAGDVIRIRATARNASGVPTDEVVQVYCQNEGSDNAPRNPRLVGFQRIHCPANADVDVEIAVPAAALRVVDEDGNRVEEGQCVFFVGVGQPDSRTQALTGHASVRVTL